METAWTSARSLPAYKTKRWHKPKGHSLKNHRHEYLKIYSVPGVLLSILEVIISAILSKKVHMYMYPIPNGFPDRTISLYSPKIVDKNEILRTVSNDGIYCSSDKLGTVYLL
jgi:hypothetical protein